LQRGAEGDMTPEKGRGAAHGFSCFMLHPLSLSRSSLSPSLARSRRRLLVGRGVDNNYAAHPAEALVIGALLAELIRGGERALADGAPTGVRLPARILLLGLRFWTSRERWLLGWAVRRFVWGLYFPLSTAPSREELHSQGACSRRARGRRGSRARPRRPSTSRGRRRGSASSRTWRRPWGRRRRRPVDGGRAAPKEAGAAAAPPRAVRGRRRTRERRSAAGGA
jgi:hypothetical protein